jgi:flagellar hook-length control protein FliK
MTPSTVDLSALASLVRGLPDAVMQASVAEHAIAIPVSDPGWSRAVAAQVQLFASANVQSATLRLSPEHLGPVEVHIDVQSTQINVSFVAAHPRPAALWSRACRCCAPCWLRTD